MQENFKNLYTQMHIQMSFLGNVFEILDAGEVRARQMSRVSSAPRLSIAEAFQAIIGESTAIRRNQFCSFAI